MNKAKILIVEDELIAAANIARNLQKFGYEVTAKVNSGEKALQKVAENLPDLVLMDIQLRGKIDGIEAAEKMRSQYQIPVVYITAYTDGITIERAKLTEPYGYLIKPFKPSDIETTIEMALHKYQSEQKTIAALAKEKEINQFKTRFLSMAAHDLRNPLTAILSSSEILKTFNDKLSSDRKIKHFDNIQTSVENMSELLEDLLLVNKAESGKLSFEPAPISVETFCQNLIKDFQLTLSDKYQVKFVCLVIKKPWCRCSCEVSLDAKLLRHILSNLLSNAIKYSPEGGPIVLELTCEFHHVTFRVMDKGIGMPPEYQKKLFSLFERAANVGDIQGTGLGLYIVKQAVEVHGGAIEVQSELNVGTTFTVTLPSSS
ncbi:MAG: hybrid sensor histidine kinase/response regulator [Okeania sp. SIO2H7]|nr:hybrid sensor histidine kinase/response regulator [Okeania sp. SIO2H7]